MAPQRNPTCTSGCLVTKRVHTVCAHITEDRTSCPRTTMWERHGSTCSNSNSSSGGCCGGGSPTSPSSSPRSPVARLFQRFPTSRADSPNPSPTPTTTTTTTTTTAAAPTGCGDPAIKIEYTIGWCPWCTSFYAPLAVDNSAMVEAYWAYKTEAGLFAPLRHPREVKSSQILSQTAATAGATRRARRPDGRWAEVESLNAALASVGVRDPSGCVVELLVRATAALRCDEAAALLLLPSMVRRGGDTSNRRVWDPRDAFGGGGGGGGGTPASPARPPWLQHQLVTPAPLHQVWDPEPTSPRLLLSEPVVGMLTVCERHSRMIAGDGMCQDCAVEEWSQ